MNLKRWEETIRRCKSHIGTKGFLPQLAISGCPWGFLLPIEAVCALDLIRQEAPVPGDCRGPEASCLSLVWNEARRVRREGEEEEG
jgi:hypothetical protein